MTELPNGWALGSVADLAGLLSGPAFQSVFFRSDGEGIRLLRGDNIEPGSLRWRNIRCWPLERLEGHEHLLLESGDVILAMDRPVISSGLKLAVTGPADLPALLVQRVARLRATPGVNERFLYYALQRDEFRSHLQKGQTGTQLPHISLKQIGDFDAAVAPYGEQERIVAAIEEAFSELDAGEAGLRIVRQLLKRMRDAVLAAAVTGRLIPQDPTDTPAAKLLAELGVEPIEPKAVPALPGGWAWAALGDVADVVGGVTKDSKRQDDPTFVERPYLRVANVQRGYLDLDVVTTIKVASAKAAKLELRPGDVLFNEGGDRDKLGRGWVWEGQVEGCIHQNHVFRARLGVDIEPKLVSIWGNTFGQGWFEGRGKQSTNLASINLTTLKSFPIPVAPVEEQRRVLSEIDRQLSFLDVCEQAVDGGLAHAAALRRSVLKAAFEGKLVPQDPSDEPASVLLERIRGERAAAPKAARRPRSTA